MNKYDLTSSAIIINDYEKGECGELEYHFKTWDPITHSLLDLGMYYDINSKRLYLPRGIDLYYVQDKLQKMSNNHITHGYISPHMYNTFKLPKLKFPPRDDRQVEALKFMCCLDKYKLNNSKSQLGINLPTGSGKTYCTIATIAYKGIASVIISAQTGILKQWKKCIFDYTDIEPSNVVELSGGHMLDRIISGKSKNANKMIYLVTHSTLKNFGDTRGWDSVGLLFKSLKIGLKIYDEAHQNFANICMIDFFTNVYKTYYVTATPNRSSEKEDIIYSLYMKNIPSIDLFEESDLKTKYIAIRYNSNPTPRDIVECRHPVYGLDRMKYVKYCSTNERFWGMFDYIFNLVEKSGGKALFFVATNELILEVKQRILINYPEYADDIGVYTTVSDNKAVEKTKRFILSTTKSAGAGEDIKNLKYTVVLAEPFKSSVLAKQTLGRTRNSGTYYLELVDMGFKKLVEFYKYKLDIFEKYALSTKEYNIPRTDVHTIINNAIDDRRKRVNRAIHNTIQEPVNAVSFTNKNEVDCLIFYNGLPSEDYKKYNLY